MRKRWQNLACVAGALALAAAAWAEVPQKINFQGRLTDANGNPLTGTYSVVLSLWDAASSGNQVWTETQSVAVSTGIYSVALGDVTALSTSVFSAADRWLQLKVGSDAAMSPRIKFQSVPYAFSAVSADFAAAAASLGAATGFGVKLSTNLVVGVSTLTAAGNFLTPGAITAANFIGDGSGLTGVSALASIFPLKNLAQALPVVQPLTQAGYTVPTGFVFAGYPAQTQTGPCKVTTEYRTDCYGQGGGPPCYTYPIKQARTPLNTTPATTNGLGACSAVVLSPGSVIATTSTANTFMLYGGLFPAASSGITVVLQTVSPSESYTVPTGKNLVVIQTYPGLNIHRNDNLTAGGVLIGGGVFPPGQTLINSTTFPVTLNGFLYAGQ